MCIDATNNSSQKYKILYKMCIAINTNKKAATTTAPAFIYTTVAIEFAQTPLQYSSHHNTRINIKYTRYING